MIFSAVFILCIHGRIKLQEGKYRNTVVSSCRSMWCEQGALSASDKTCIVIMG